MNKQEKIAWYSIIVLSLAIVLYLILFQIVEVKPNFHISVIIFISANVLMILCNFGDMIFFKKKLDPGVIIDEDEKGNHPKANFYHHLFYWGACISVITGTWFWVTFEMSGALSNGLHHVLIFSALGMSLLYTFILHLFKKRRGENIEASSEYSVSDLIFQRVRPGYDERDFHIQQKAMSHGRSALYVVLFFGFWSSFAWGRAHGFGSIPVNLNIILLILAGVQMFKYYVYALSTIIQYRIGR